MSETVPLTPEARVPSKEDVEHAKDYVHDVLLNGATDVYDLQKLRESFTGVLHRQRYGNDGGASESALYGPNRAFLDNLGLLAHYEGLISGIDAAIQKKLDECVDELITDVFDRKKVQFETIAVLGEDRAIIEGVVKSGESIVPVIAGLPYEGALDDIDFKDFSEWT